MTIKFTYKPRNLGYEDIGQLLLGLAIIIVPLISPFDLRYRRIKIAPYPYSMYILVFIGVSFLIYQVMHLLKEARMRDLARPIIVEGDKIQFVELSRKGAIERTIYLSQVRRINYNADCQTIIVCVPSGEFKFEGKYFKEGCFSQFCNLFENRHSR